jgi:hypothetical protein
MMKRREFLQQIGLGLAATWVLGRLSWPFKALAGNDREIRLALLADTHLIDGDDRRPEAWALARAVADIRALKPPPDLVLFAGDLAHRGHPQALALGREILADLPVAPLMVMGEGDGPATAGSPWTRLFGEPRFFYRHRGLNVLGLHTQLIGTPQGRAFELGAAQRGRLARELARLDPEIPLIILSHAPLAKIFRPWQQWTLDGETLLAPLCRFQKVLFLHGHVHHAAPGTGRDGTALLNPPPPLVGRGWGEEEVFTPTPAFPPQEGGSPGLITGKSVYLGLPATAWPLPVALQGTPAALRPGSGPAGCGWGLLSWRHDSLQFQPHLWQT